MSHDSKMSQRVKDKDLSSDSPVEKPVEDHVVGLFSFPLRSHMTNTMDCSEGKTISLLNVSSNVII